MNNSEFKDFTNRTGLTLSNGNKKLVSKPGLYQFLIFNIPAVETCPYATENCIKFCYARKAERIYPNVLKARERNFKASKKQSFVNDMLSLIAHYMSKPAFKNVPVYFRIHESGDFYSKAYFNKWMQIIETCRDIYPNLYFNCYTKSIPFIDFKTYSEFRAARSNCVLNISIWNDTPKSTINFAARGAYPIYTAADAVSMPALLTEPHTAKCTCKDCGACKLCLIQNPRILTKICLIH